MNSIDWQLIEVFLRVAEEGSFTRAAEMLGTSQPTVSRQIHNLEESIGVSLFARHARGFELTERGQALLETARQVESDVQTFLRRASGMTSEIKGAVRISASEPVAAYLLMPFFAEFMSEHPSVDIELVAQNRPADLLRREADIAIRMFKPRQLDLVIRHACDIPVGLFGHESYLERHGTPTTREELLQHTLIGYDADKTGIESFEQAGLPRESFSFRTDSLVAQFEAIKAGVGIGGAQVPVMEKIDGVRPVLPEFSPPPIPVWLAVHKDLRHSPTIRAVMEGLAGFLATKVR